MGKARANPFVFSIRIACAGIALLVTLSASALPQDRNSLVQRCLTITDVNERVDCLENGGAPDLDAASTQRAKAPKQQGASASFDCRAARNSIERAICADITLSEWDSRMGQAFQQALRLTKDRQSLLENQRLWLTQRDNNCGALADTVIWSCLLEMTKSRSTVLAKAIASTVDTAQSAQPSAPPTIPTITQTRPEPSGPNTVSASPVSQNDRSKGASPKDEGFPTTVSFIVLAIGSVIALQVFSVIRRKRLLAEEEQRIEDRRLAEENRLIEKYGKETAARIIARRVWQGMTAEQLIESWGNPTDVGREIIKAKIKETWKYGQTGRNRFSNRVYLENGVVIGWKI